MDDVKDKLYEIVSFAINKKPEDVANKTFEELNIDSLTAVNITFEIEETFGITVKDDIVYKLESVDDVISLVTQELENKSNNE